MNLPMPRLKGKVNLKRRLRLAVLLAVILLSLVAANFLSEGRRETNKALNPTLTIKKLKEGKLIAEVLAAATGVSKVEFYIDGALKSTDTTSPYNYSWDTKTIGDGSHTILAKAYDNASPVNVGQASATVTVDNTAPSVSVTAPTNGATVSGVAVTVSANASDTAGIQKVEFYRDTTTLIGTDTTSPYSTSWDSTTVANGSHTLSAKAYDNANPANIATSAAVSVNVNNVAPCTRSNPLVSLSPASQSGGPGTSLNYTFSVTNQDSASCASSTFSLAQTIPAGWSATFTPTSLSLAPGAAGTSTFKVTSSASAAIGNFTVTAKATNQVDNTKTASASATYVVLDTIPPTTPTNLTATAISATRVDLAWSPSTDNVGVTAYLINREGVTIAQTSTTSYSDTSALPNTTYHYNASARDAAGNTSGLSNTATVTTPNQADTQKPSIPTNLRATLVTANQINLAWNASTDNVGVAGYYVNRDGVRIATVTTTTFGDSTVSPNTRYVYTVQAFDAASNVSDPSLGLTVTTLLACSRANPTVSLIPASQFGKAGTSLNYTFSVTNNDSNGCGSSSFSLTRSIPAGWSASFTPTSSSLAPGAAATSTLKVTSSSSAAVGSYTISATATNSSNPAYSASAQATYKVFKVLTIRSADDATIDKTHPTTKYGASTSLIDDYSAYRNFLMKFSVSGVGSNTVTSAVLKIYCTNPSVRGGYFYKTTTTSWQEETVTWNTRPALGSKWASLGSVSSGKWYSINLTGKITKDGVVSLRVTSTSSDGAVYYSKEKGSSYAPRLVLTVKP